MESATVTTHPPISIARAAVRRLFAAETFQKAQAYYWKGAVLSMQRRANTVEGKVQGNDVSPYRVTATLSPDKVTAASCTCPYQSYWEGWCKHIGALLLACVYESEAIEERPTFEQMIADLNAREMRDLLLKLANRRNVADMIEKELGKQQPKKAKTRVMRAVPTPVPALSDWQEEEVIDETRTALADAATLSKQDDGRAALALLAPATDAYVRLWATRQGSHSIADYFEPLGQAWCEALLTASLTSDERDSWAKKLNAWLRVLIVYRIDRSTLEAALDAADQGWDDPALVRVLNGKAPTRETWDTHFPSVKALGKVRLAILERQGRREEYLNVAQSEGLPREYMTMAVGIGKIKEATNYGLKQLQYAEDSAFLAKLLYDHGAKKEALKIAKRGLQLVGRKSVSAGILRDMAYEMGDKLLAIESGMTAFRDEPNLESYQRLLDVAGTRRAELRDEMLAHLQKVSKAALAFMAIYNPHGNNSYYPTNVVPGQTSPYTPEGPLEILLHENMYDDAIAIVESYAKKDLIEQVCDAALEAKPYWVIETCRKHAEHIMDQKRAAQYDTAVAWLEKARDAYRTTDRYHEWQDYHHSLLLLHQKKSKLLPMLEMLAE